MKLLRGKRGQQVFDVPFQIKERKPAPFLGAIHIQGKSIPGRAQAQAPRFCRIPSLGLVDMPRLEQAHVIAASIQVVGDHLQHAWYQ